MEKPARMVRRRARIEMRPAGHFLDFQSKYAAPAYNPAKIKSTMIPQSPWAEYQDTCRVACSEVLSPVTDWKMVTDSTVRAVSAIHKPAPIDQSAAKGKKIRGVSCERRDI